MYGFWNLKPTWGKPAVVVTSRDRLSGEIWKYGLAPYYTVLVQFLHKNKQTGLNFANLATRVEPHTFSTWNFLWVPSFGGKWKGALSPVHFLHRNFSGFLIFCFSSPLSALARRQAAAAPSAAAFSARRALAALHPPPSRLQGRSRIDRTTIIN